MPLSHLKIPTIVPTIKIHSFTNELQMKCVKSLWLNNILLIYLSIFFTVKLLGVGQ